MVSRIGRQCASVVNTDVDKTRRRTKMRRRRWFPRRGICLARQTIVSRFRELLGRCRRPTRRAPLFHDVFIIFHIEVVIHIRWTAWHDVIQRRIPVSASKSGCAVPCGAADDDGGGACTCAVAAQARDVALRPLPVHR